MRRGTTPTHIFNTDIDLTAAEVVYLTYKQSNKILLQKEKDELTITEEQVTVKLTQEETLAFKMNQGEVEMQIRARFPDGTAVASNVMQTTTQKILREGVI